MEMEKEQLKAISEGRASQTKIYERPKLSQHLVETEHLLKPGSVEKTVNDGGMKEQWEEQEVTETFTWEW